MRTVVVAGLFLLVGLAGCVDDAGSDVDMVEGEEVEPGLHVPVWQVGDGWTWEIEDGPEYTFIVSGINSDGDYIVDVADDQQAFEAAAFGDPLFGVYRASDLAHQMDDGTFVSWFDWPLTDGKSWSVQWFGTIYRVTAMEMAEDHYRMVSRNGAVLANEFDYFADMGFYDNIVWYDQETGEPSWVMDATRERGYDDDVVRADVTQLVAWEDEGVTNYGPFGFDTSDTQDADIYASMAVSCEQGWIEMTVGSAETVAGVDPGNEGARFAGNCPLSAEFYGVAVEAPGDDRAVGWGAAANMESPDVVWHLTAWMARYDRFAPGEAPEHVEQPSG